MLYLFLFINNTNKKMKQFRNLFMILAVSVSFTTMASTPSLEEKQKTTIFQESKTLVDVENVQIFAAATADVFLMSYKTQLPIFNFNLTNHFFESKDVGWKLLKAINNDSLVENFGSNNKQKILTVDKPDIPKEVTESLTYIVLQFEKTGKVPDCNDCRGRCQIQGRVTEGDCVIYHFACDSGSHYWAVYTNGTVHVSPMYPSGPSAGTISTPPHYPCQ